MSQNKTIISQVRKLAGDKFAEKLKTCIDKKYEKGKTAIAAIIKGKTITEAAAASGIDEKDIKSIVYNLNRSGTWKEKRYKSFLPLDGNGEPDMSVLPLKVKVA